MCYPILYTEYHMEGYQLNKIIAKNLEIFISQQRIKKDWIQQQLGIDKATFLAFLQGEEHTRPHLEAFAKLFHKDAQDFMSEDFVAPPSFQETMEKQKQYADSTESDFCFAVIKLGVLADTLREATDTQQYPQESLQLEIIELIGKLEEKAIQYTKQTKE